MKNMKVVSRNWTYFLVLLIFPLLLIAVAGIMLDSHDPNNVKIGVINEDSEYNIDLQNSQNAINYNSLGECLVYLTNHKISSCVHIRKEGETHNIDVYLDNTQKIVEYFSRQFILEHLLETQFGIIEQTSYQINEQLKIYSSSLNEAGNELVDARVELLEQEQILVSYREKLTLFRTDFNRIYWDLKALEPDIQSAKASAQNVQDVNFVSLKNDVQRAQSDLSILRSFLSVRLVSDDYNYAADRLDSIDDTLGDVYLVLNQVETSSNIQNLDQILNKVDEAIAALDQIKESLDQLDRDLADAISKIRNTITKVDEFIYKLEDARRNLDEFSSSVGSNYVSMNFRDAFNIPDDPVLISFPQLITIIISFSSLIISNKFVSNMVRKPSYRREIITPTRDVTYLVADYLINIFFILIQIIVLFTLGVIWFGMPIGSLVVFTGIILLTSSVLIFAGISLGYLIKTESISMLSTIFLVMFLFIFSDLLLPSALTGPIVRFFINLNPFVILNNVLKDIILLHEVTDGFVTMVIKMVIMLFSSGFIAYLSKKGSREDVTQ